MMKLLLSLTIALSLISAQALAQQSTEDFAKSTDKSNRLAIQESELAASQGDDATRALAQQFLNDERLNTNQLHYLTGQADDPQAPPPKLDDKQQQQMDKLKGLKGDDLSSQYVNDLMAQQQKEVATFQSYMQSGQRSPAQGVGGPEPDEATIPPAAASGGRGAAEPVAVQLTSRRRNGPSAARLILAPARDLGMGREPAAAERLGMPDHPFDDWKPRTVA